MNSSVGKNISYQMIYRVLTILTPLITAPILSRALGADKLGVYSASLAWVNYFVLFSMLGIADYGNRSIAAFQADSTARQSSFWNIYAVQFSACISSMLLYAISFLFLSPERYTVSVLQGLWLISSLLNVNWYFFGTERFRLTVTRSIIVKIISVVLIVALIRKPEDLLLYTAIMAVDAVLSNGLLWPFLLREIRFQKPEWEVVKKHIKPIFVLFIPVLAISIFHVMDKTMLDWLSTETQVGYYYSADKVINIPLMAITAVSTVMMPRIANLYATGTTDDVKKTVNRSIEITVFLSCSVGIGIASIARQFVPFFFGPGYDPCITLVYWFTPILFVKTLGDFIRMQYLIPTHHDRLYIYAVCAGALTNVILNTMLIPGYGAMGAVWATLIAEIVVTAIEMISLRKEIKFLRLTVSNIVYFVFAIIMFFAVRLVDRSLHCSIVLELISMIIVGGLVYLGMCLVYWHFNKKSVFYNIIS